MLMLRIKSEGSKDILLELIRKEIIVDVKTYDMQKVFYVEHRNNMDF